MLPPEILEMVFHHLDALDVNSSSQVCVQWRAVARSVGGKTPLLSPPILERILGFLDFKSVLVARQVCKVWKLVLDHLTRRNHGFRPNGVTRLTRRCLRFPWNNIVEKIQLMPISLNHDDHIIRNPFPTRSCHLWFQCNLGPTLYLELLRSLCEILKVAGSHIHRLSVTIAKCDLPDCFNYTLAVKFLQEGMPHLDNLEGLEVHTALGECDCSDMGPKGMKRFLNIVSEVLGGGGWRRGLRTNDKLTKLRLHLPDFGIPEEPPSLFVFLIAASPKLTFLNIESTSDDESRCDLSLIQLCTLWLPHLQVLQIAKARGSLDSLLDVRQLRRLALSECSVEEQGAYLNAEALLKLCHQLEQLHVLPTVAGRGGCDQCVAVVRRAATPQK